MDEQYNSLHTQQVIKEVLGLEEFKKLVNVSFSTLTQLEDYSFYAFKALSSHNIKKIPGYKILSAEKKKRNITNK